MCIACREMKQKSELIRIVINEDCSEYHIGNGKANGRGAYICNTNECIAKCIKTKALNKSYKKAIPDIIYQELKKVELNK